MASDGASVASTIVTLMMNGVCCKWQMRDDEDFDDRHHLFCGRSVRVATKEDKEPLPKGAMMHSKTNDLAYGPYYDSTFADSRRRHVQQCKMRACQQESLFRNPCHDNTPRCLFGPPTSTYDTNRFEHPDLYDLHLLQSSSDDSRQDTASRLSMMTAPSLMDLEEEETGIEVEADVEKASSLVDVTL